MSVAQAVEALTAARAERRAEIERIEQALVALGVELDVDDMPSGLGPIKRTPRAEAVKAAAAVMVECPECGKTMSQLGIGPHRRMKHGVTAGGKRWTPEMAAAAIEAL